MPESVESLPTHMGMTKAARPPLIDIVLRFLHGGDRRVWKSQICIQFLSSGSLRTASLPTGLLC